MNKELSDREEKMEGLWCDFCGERHAGRCEKTPSLESKDKGDWEIEFRKQFADDENPEFMTDYIDGKALNPEQIIDFISTTLKAERERLVERLEYVRPPKPYPNVGNGYNDELSPEEKAVDEMLVGLIAELQPKDQIKECCPQCSSDPSGNDYAYKERCLDSNCPCHTPTSSVGEENK